MTRRDPQEELRARLRGAAGAHRPDRGRILARVERGMAGPARPERGAAPVPVSGWLRVAGATAAVAGVLAVGGYAVASAVRGEEPPRQRQVAVSPASTPSPGATSGVPEPAAGVANGPLWSDGSVDPHSNAFWAQSEVTLRTKEPLTALTVELRIEQTGGVSSTGAWRSLPEGDFDLAVDERDGFLVYTWNLRAGRTVPAGTWVFAGQYHHERGGRDAGGDTYTVRAGTGSPQRSVGGGFAARDDTDAADDDGA
ncbi:hypothetical protein ACIF9R_05495 [Streptomyces sp. NPDC086080]|uniref:hypothetical protein n=1 Tax=Streptomyces sp. NPDC086080 TaxID=3365748 RepID=UPI0037D074A4